MPHEHGWQAQAPRLTHPGPPRGGSPGWRYSNPAHRRGRVMDATPATFKDNVAHALSDRQQQHAMTETGPRFIQKRAKAREALPEFDLLRDQARDIKDHVLEFLDVYLERYEEKVLSAGGQVHWAATSDEARAVILDICQRA